MLQRLSNVSVHGRGRFVCLFFFSILKFFPHENPAELRRNAAEPQAHLPRCGWMGGVGVGDQLRVQPLKIAVS